MVFQIQIGLDRRCQRTQEIFRGENQPRGTFHILAVPSTGRANFKAYRPLAQHRPSLSPCMRLRRIYCTRYSYLRHILRENFCAKATDRSSQLVFIDRNAGSRGLLNQEEVLTKLSSSHQDVVVAQLETLHPYEQADMLRSAGIIVGMHGVAFTWLLLVSAGVSVVEIFPYGWTDPCYRNLARISGLFVLRDTKHEQRISR